MRRHTRQRNRFQVWTEELHEGPSGKSSNFPRPTRAESSNTISRVRVQEDNCTLCRELSMNDLMLEYSWGYTIPYLVSLRLSLASRCPPTGLVRRQGQKCDKPLPRWSALLPEARTQTRRNTKEGGVHCQNTGLFSFGLSNTRLISQVGALEQAVGVLMVGKGRNAEFVFGEASMGNTATRRGRGAERVVIGRNPRVLYWNGSGVARTNTSK